MNRLIVVSNRLPFALDSTGEDLWTVTPAAGGLVSAVVPVALSETDRDEFYYGYSNEVIWPLFHDLQNFCNFEPGYWQTYKAVNDRFADTIARCAQPNDFIWVHDYHLMYVAQALRERGVSQKLSGLTFFLHIPFPSYDIFAKLPQQQRLLRALLQFDLLGFQTRRDLRNFLQCVRHVMSEAEVLPSRGVQLIHLNERKVCVSSFPIGIDYESFEQGAASKEVAQRASELRTAFPR